MISIPEIFAKHWPDWIAHYSIETSAAINDINRSYKSLYSGSLSYTYYRMLNVELYELARTYDLLPDLSHPFSQVFNNTLDGQAQKKAIRVHAHGLSEKYISLRAYRFGKKLILLRLFSSAATGFEKGDFLSAFSALRAILEHIATYNLLEGELNNTLNRLDKKSYESYETIFNKSGEILDKRILATRINWSAFKELKMQGVKHKRLKYLKQDYTADTEAANLLTSLDKMDKHIGGIRLAYDVLCEFVHPNVGTMWTVREKSEFIKDSMGVSFERVSIGAGYPTVISKQLAPLVSDMIILSSQAMKYWEIIDKGMKTAESNYQKVVQYFIRRLELNKKNIFLSKERCPCASGKELRKCCG